MQRRVDAPPPGFITQSYPPPTCLSDNAETKKTQGIAKMTTGCMRSTLEPDHRLMTQEGRPYGLLESLVDAKAGMSSDEKEEKDTLCGENQEDLLKKPRRKDTPVLNSPPHIPGVRLLKAEEQMVHIEDEEEDLKD